MEALHLRAENEFDVEPLAYDKVLDAIRAGIRIAKSVPLTDEEITPSTYFWLTDSPDQSCLSLDSVDFLRLIVFLEEEYGWSIPETDIDASECRTVGDMASLVIKHVRGDHQRAPG